MKLRHYQEEAARRIVASYLSGASRAVVQMAEGSGKVLTAQVALERIAAEKGRLSIAWVGAFDELIASWSPKAEASRDLEITSLKYTQLISDVASGAISHDRYDVVVFFDPGRMLNGLEEVISYFSGFSLMFTSSSSASALLVDNEKYLIYQYSFEQALLDGAVLSLDLETDLRDLNAQVKEGSSTIKLSEELRRAEAKSSELRRIMALISQGKVSYDDILGLQQKKAELRIFERLLTDEDFFQNQVEHRSTPESVWQCFFQRNQWIFGFGLNYVFNTPLQDGKLEQVVSGYSVHGSGKRVDALLRSNGAISSLCFAEIKTHRKSLLRQVKTEYRPGAWAISDELAGAIAQVQRTVQVSMENIKTSLAVRDAAGYESGERLYLYKPKSFLVIGALSEFTNDLGYIHEAKFSSFQMFRNALPDIEIITFDELYERAKGLLETSAGKSAP